MGNSQSSPTKDETRRANRLSKPLTKKLATLGSPQLPRLEKDTPELATGLIGWQNPWVGYSLSTDIRSSHPKAREIPPTLFEAEPGPSNKKTAVESPVQSPVDPNSEPISPLSGSVSASRSVRRASCQPGIYGSSSQLSRVPEQPRRANSTRTTLSRHNSVIYENTIEDATSSNTHFLVGNQRFSLTRRRSLLTRPGVATRRSTGAVRRVPSPIGEPRDPVDDLTESKGLQWPLPPRQRPALTVEPIVRPTSPADSRYTQLGALKLGSLRVVNGAASPCPSERAPLDRPLTTGPGLGLDNVDSMGPRGSTLVIPAVPDLKNSDDVPGSPFSFEKSPTITVPSRTKSIFPEESEDEGIAMSDEGNGQLDKAAVEADLDRSTSRSLNKSDSGYSSAASVRSYHHSRTRASFDSQNSGFCTADSAKTVWVTSDQSCSHLNDHVQRHFSLQEAKAKPGNYSRLHPNFGRWYDSTGPATQQPLAGLRARRSTLCAPRYTEYPAQNKPGSETKATAREESALAVQEDQPASRGSFYADRFSTGAFDVSHSSSASSTLETDTPPSYQQIVITDVRAQVYRSASERYINSKSQHGLLTHRSRPRSQSLLGRRLWCQKPGIGIPRLPTILSPDHPHAGEEQGLDFAAPEPLRGRPRSRSQDYRRRKLTKTHPQPDVHMMTSAYAPH
ncbi:uncharacterized protein N7482_008645 [Penicillium canariense]|uniref:Uncharacterized protein n=1 Tax=Penicillium canariense TaxID=189055 RepID=A0A9W9HWN1_9EURO|nr:uncharacterized protein N7482_008645 [Penicillium canariense]KAJ5157545.1 hypothetical protein N7482_008645 [Penicillium canariense]